MQEDKESIYDEDTVEELEEGDEISEVESGFMKGYRGFKGGKCCYCEKVILDNPVEIEIDGETYRFCSSECADKFMKRKKA
jgi:hypothetical protein